MLHCSHSLTSVPHLTRLTTLSCWRDCLRLSVWADKPTRGSTRTSLADLNPCGWGALHHPGHRSVLVFLKDRYSGQSCTSFIPPMLPGLSNHSGSRFTCTPTTLKSTVPAVSHDRSSYPNFSFSSLTGLMTGCRLTVFVWTRIRRNLSGSVLDTSCLTSTLVQSLSSLHRHRFAIWVCCLILNWQWRDISPNYVSCASSSFVASGPSVIHSLAMHYLRLCMRSSPRGSTFATAFCMVSVLTSSIVFNPFSTLRQGLFWKSRSTIISQTLCETSCTGSLLRNVSTSRFAFSCATVWRVLVHCTYPNFATWWAPRQEDVIFVLLPDQIWWSLDTALNVMVVEVSQLRGRICGIYFLQMFGTMKLDWTLSRKD